MERHSLCLAWNWEYDADFVSLLDHACQVANLTLVQATPARLPEFLQALAKGKLWYDALYDRASDTDASFLPLSEWAGRNGALVINPHEKAYRCWDKAAMHSAIARAGRHTPATIILPPHDTEPELPPLDLEPLGRPFIIKPAHGGGGDGVVTDATCLEHIIETRKHFAADKYLLQARIEPACLGGRPAWFRVLYCTGTAYPCWWDTSTHLYVPVSPAEESQHGLRPLRSIADTTAHSCGLSLFSTEIALTPDGRFVAVDYVNDPVDLRLQSKAEDGVPDPIVQDIAARLASFVATHTSGDHPSHRHQEPKNF